MCFWMVVPPSPRQKLVDTIDGMIGDDGKDIAEIGFGIDAVEFGGFDERVDGGGAFASCI